MAVLNIRNLPDEVHRKLRVRAAGKGRSMEAEARAILAATCEAESPVRSAIHLQRMVDKLYGGKRPKSAVDALIKERRAEASRE
jgi:plasmid stability protein